MLFNLSSRHAVQSKEYGGNAWWGNELVLKCLKAKSIVLVPSIVPAFDWYHMVPNHTMQTLNMQMYSS